MLNLKYLATFLEVCRNKSVTQAANHLHLTQPAVSLHMKKLEQMLGARLLARIDGRFELTDYGRAFLPFATALCNLSNRAQREIESIREEKSTEIVIGTGSFFAEHYLPEILTAFKEIKPGTAIRCFSGPTRVVEEKVKSFECDFAFVGRVESTPELATHPIIEDDIVLVVSSHHALAKKARVSLSELAKWPLIGFADGSETQAEIDKLFEEHDVTPNRDFAFSSAEGVKRAVETGFGVALFPFKAAEREVRDGRLKAVRMAGVTPRRCYTLAYRLDSPLTSTARAFRDVVLAARNGWRREQSRRA